MLLSCFAICNESYYMKTVVYFSESRRPPSEEANARSNRVLTRTLGKVGFIDNRGFVAADGRPAPDELSTKDCAF